MKNIYPHYLPFIFYLSSFIFYLSPSFSQTNPCTPNTPVYYVNLTGNPSGTWVSSPPIVRDGSCCGSLWPDRCVVFLITLDTGTIAINFNIASGAVPPGAMFYQIDCGPTTQVGQPICLQGPGPYALTFCKPGANLNTYAITAIGAPIASQDVTVGVGCNTTISVSGLNPSSVTWTSVFPGAQGSFNNYLNCVSGCTTTVVTPQPGAPAFVDYKVCGQSLAPTCLPDPNFCDTVRVFFTPALSASVTPDPAVYCSSSGGITLNGNVSGGDGNYFYQWTNQGGTVVGNASIYFASIPGTYIFQVYDGQYPGCPAKYDTVSVTQQVAPTVNAGPDKTICSGGSIGLSGTMTGATGISWSGGGSFNPNNISLNVTYTPSSAEIAAGSATLVLSSTGNGVCPPATDQVIIIIKPPLTVTIAGSSIVCFGATTQLTANVSGGTAPYSFSWNTGATSQSIIATPGNYSVTVTDMSTGICTGVATFSVLQDPQVSVTVSPNSSINCSVTTAISATPSGGNGSFSYLWNTGQTSQTVIVYPGIYTVTVTDGVGCTATGTVSVSGANSTLSGSIQQPSNLCFGGTKNITVVATGGFGGYNYQWSTGPTTQTINVSAGTYCCTVTDAGGCITTACVTVNQNSPLSVSITNPSPVCNGAMDTISAVPNGGQSPYTYLWNTGQTSQSIIQPAGTYSVTVTDANQNGGCTASSTAVVYNEPNFTISISSNNVSCFGGNNGNASVSASGGVPGYIYQWSPSGGTSTTAGNLSAGNYTINVTDNIGCTQSGTVSITEPLVLFASISVNSNVSCNGGNTGSATVSISGGTTPYSYQWSPYGGTGATATGLIAGIYTVTISDSKGCTNSATTSITQPAVLTATISGTNVSCNSGNNGTATVSPSGGTSPYFYNWSNGGNTATVSNLSPGNYSVTVSDSKGCTVIKTVTISQPSTLTANISSSANVSCNGAGNGMATALGNGGTLPYVFQWSNAATQSSVNNLLPATYTVTVSDSNGCIATADVNITEPPVLIASASPDQSIACNNTVILSSSPSGGTTNYSYQWSNGASTSSITSNTPGIYIITVVDANGCSAVDSVIVSSSNSTLNASVSAPDFICNGSGNGTATANATGGNPSYSYLWSNGATQSSISNLQAGFYCVTVTDGDGCKITSCVNIQNEPAFSVTVTPNAACFGTQQTITSNVTGGISPYSFLWSTGETTQSVLKNAGTYSVTVTDSILCTASVTITVSEAPLLQATFSNIFNVSCKGTNDGVVTANPTGGTPGYTYQWSPVASVNSSIYNLSPGTYSVTVTDAIGCTANNSVTITEPSSALALDSITGSNISCYGGNNGFATVGASGGYPPYNYLWWYDGDTVTTKTNLFAGYYSISAADTGGCVVVKTIYLSQPPPLNLLTGVIAHVSCNGGANGSATAQVSGGKTPYVFQWSNGGTTATITGLTAGTYTVTITDANGCIIQSVLPVQIAQPAAILIMPTITAAVCTSATGSVIVNVTGGTAPYQYSWSNGATTAILNNVIAGTYNITVTDTASCIQAQQVTVGTSQPNITIFSSFTNTICTSSTGSASLNPSGGSSPYSYQWSNGVQTQSIASLQAGTYYVTVTDSTGCVKTDSVIIGTTQPAINVSVNQTSAICASATGSAFISNISGGNSPYSFLWSNGANNDTLSNISAGTYGLTVTDSLGCDTSKMVTISATQSTVSITVNIIQNVNCYGGNDGFLSLNNASGGAPPYTYTWISPAATGQIIDSLPAGNYTISVVDANTCSKDSTFTIIEPAVISWQQISSTDIVCKGDTNGTAEVIVSGGTSPYTYVWNTGGQTQSIAPLPTGIYSVTVTDDNGCTKDTSITISEPLQALTASIDSSTNASCKNGNDGTAIVTPSGGIAPYTYLWSNGENISSIASLDSGKYVVTVTDNNGCTAKDSVIISAPPLIVVAISGNTNICSGQSATLTASSTGGTSPYTFVWTGFGNSNPITVSPDSTTIYYISITDDKGCTGTDSVTVYVNAPINAELLAAPNDTICAGDSITIHISSFGGTGNYTYNWLNPPLGATQDSTMTVSPSINTTYLVSISDLCSTPASASITIIVNPVPTAFLNAVPLDGCAPIIIDFSSNTQGNPIGTTYLWNFGDGETSTFTNTIHTYTQAGTYLVALTATTEEGCSVTIPITSEINIYPQPNANFNANPESTMLTFPNVVFTNNSSGAIGYQWNFGDGSSSSDSSVLINHTYKDTGTFPVTLIVTNEFGCTDTFLIDVTILPEFQFWIPNAFTPVDNNGKNDLFSGKGICIADYEMYIFDRWGDEIYHSIDINKGWDGHAHRGKKEAQIGVYVYLVYITDCIGEPHRYLGHVTLVR